MFKKIVCFILMMCICLSSFVVPTKADHFTLIRQIKVKCLNDKTINTYEVYVKDGRIYIELYVFAEQI